MVTMLSKTVLLQLMTWLIFIRHYRSLFRCCKPWRKRRGGLGRGDDPVSQSQSPWNWMSAATMLEGSTMHSDVNIGQNLIEQYRITTVVQHYSGEAHLCHLDSCGSRWKRDQPVASPLQTPARVKNYEGWEGRPISRYSHFLLTMEIFDKHTQNKSCVNLTNLSLLPSGSTPGGISM